MFDPRSARPSLLLVALAMALPGAAIAAETITLTLKNHRFEPDHVQVPAGERFHIQLTNADSTTAELESADMKVEKIVVAGGTITVAAGPLHPGTYSFVDDYNDSAKGSVTAVAAKPEG